MRLRLPEPASAARWALAAAGGAALAHIGPGIMWIGPVRRRLAPTLSGLGTPGHLALTFDDGPDPDGTPAVLEALDQLEWRATFFLLGRQVRARPELAREVAAAGHEIALHGYGHRYLFLRTPGGTYDDLARGLDAVTDATGVRPRWFRPVYGVLTTPALWAARRLELRTVLWSAWGREWRPEATPESVHRNLRRGVLDGGTVLLHDSDVSSAPGCWRLTVDALYRLSGEVRRRRVSVGPLSEHGLACSDP